MSSSGIRAGRAFVEIGANATQFLRALKRAQQRLRAFGESVKAIGLRVAAVGGAVAMAGMSMAKIFADMGDVMHKMAQRTGFSTEALSELGLAAELSGADLAALENGIRKMQKSIGDAGRELTTPIDALEKLGLTFEQLNGLSPEQQFEMIADGIARIKDPTERASVAMDLLGKSGTKLIPLMAGGAAGMAAMRKQARDLGLTISQVDADSAALLTDTLAEMWRAVKQVAFVIGSALAPSIIAVTKPVTQVVVSIIQWIKGNRALAVTVFKVGAAVMAAGVALVALGTGIVASTMVMGSLGAVASLVAGAVYAAFSVIPTVISAILTPLGLAVIAVGALAAILIDWGGVVDNVVGWAAEKFQWLRKSVGSVLGGIRDALASGDTALAAEILWKALKLAWQYGIAALDQLWINAKKSFLSVTYGMWSGALAAAEIAFHSLESAWIETTAFLSKTWTNFTSGFSKAWNTAINWTTKRLLELWGMFDETLDVEVAKKMADDDLSDLNEQIDRERDAKLEGREAQRQAERETSDAVHEDTIEVIGQDYLDALEALNQATNASIEKTKTELEAAKKALADAIAKAKADREAAEKDIGPARRKSQFGGADSSEEWAKGVQKALKVSVSTVGTFSPAALSGLGYSGAEERIAKATEITAKYTKWLADGVKNNRVAFT